jgi:hypothetical protein
MAIELLKEIERLRPLNPDIRRYERGWLKLVATARVLACRRLGYDDSLAMDILRAHEVGMDANIVINV